MNGDEAVPPMQPGANEDRFRFARAVFAFLALPGMVAFVIPLWMAFPRFFCGGEGNARAVVTAEEPCGCRSLQAIAESDVRRSTGDSVRLVVMVHVPRAADLRFDSRRRLSLASCLVRRALAGADAWLVLGGVQSQSATLDWPVLATAG